MRSLVTGGAGFIGSHLVERLVAEGDEVMVVDNLSTGSLDNLDGINSKDLVIEIAAVENAASTDSVMRRFMPDRVFHLAAQVSVPRSTKAPISDFETNALGTAVLLEAASRHDVGHIVFSSTGGAIYGEANTVPTDEDYPALPMSPYGQHKLLGELGAGFYSRQKGLGVTVLRFANVYGPRQGGSGESGVISLFTGAALENIPVTIYGSGEQTRDFVYVLDVVDAMILASEVDGGGGPYNIGTGSELSINQLVQEMERQGIILDCRYAEEREGEVQRSSLSAEKANRDLGWRAKTSFSVGLRATLEQMKRDPIKKYEQDFICIDVGGATISYADISATTEGDLCLLEAPRFTDKLLDAIAEIVKEQKSWALALPGTVSGRRYWTRSAAYNIMDRVVDLQQEFTDRGVAPPAIAENDVFALARGAALENPGLARFAVINIGFGLGGALNIFGWPQKGVAQEIGHIALPGNSKKCSCGLHGCIGTILAGEFIDYSNWDSFCVGDQFEQSRQALLFLLKNIKMMLAPEAVVLSGGSFWGKWEREIDSLEQELRETTLQAPGSSDVLLAASGPLVSLRGLFDLSRTENYPK